MVSLPVYMSLDRYKILVIFIALLNGMHRLISLSSHLQISSYLIFILNICCRPDMAAFRSSVRPTNSKQPWGTILKPEFGLGYQKMTGYEIDQTVNRLCVSPTPKCRTYSRVGKKMSSEEIDEMVIHVHQSTINFWTPIHLSP